MFALLQQEVPKPQYAGGGALTDALAAPSGGVKKEKKEKKEKRKHEVGGVAECFSMLAAGSGKVREMLMLVVYMPHASRMARRRRARRRRSGRLRVGQEMPLTTGQPWPAGRRMLGSQVRLTF